MFTIEEKISNYIEKHLYIIGLIVFTAISFFMRWSCIKYQSVDYKGFLLNWWDEISMFTGLNALHQPIGDYNVPYLTCLLVLTHITDNSLYAIKIFSIFFDYISAIGIGLIVFQLTTNKSKAFIGYIATIFAPTLILNSAYWGQCDSIYVSFLILSLWQLLKEHYAYTFILFSIALSFKLEAIFLLPLLIILYFVNRKFSIINFASIPAIFLIMCTPAIISGKSIKGIIDGLHYQVEEYQYLTLNYPNLYTIICGEYSDLKWFGIWLTIGLQGIILLLLLREKARIKTNDILSLAMFTVLICLFFLPSMHERYGLIIDLLSIAYLVLYPKRFYITLGINFASLTGYASYLWNINNWILTFSTMILLAILIIIPYILVKDNELISSCPNP